MKLIWYLLFQLITILTYGQNDQLSASDILDSSIAFCGNLPLNTRSELTYRVMLADSSSLVIDEKRIEGSKFTQSVLSVNHFPQTTFFDGIEQVIIDGDSIYRNTRPDEIKLKAFTNVQIGYKQLNYKLTRKEDVKFRYFDCYVVEAVSENGYRTLNYFDKKNFRLLMIIYPNGNKSLMMEYKFINGTLVNSLILNTSPNTSNTQEFRLIDFRTDGNFSDLWFNCPYQQDIRIPNSIKFGQFQSTNGEDTRFVRDQFLQTYFDENNNPILKRYLKWTNIDTVTMMSEEDFLKESELPESLIKVRIISWDQDSYVCHWIAGKYSGTQDYRKID